MFYNGTVVGGTHDVLDEIIKFAKGSSVSSITLTNGGTGYAVLDVLTLTGGTGDAARILVVSVDGSGVITKAVLDSGGSYTANPPTSQTPTGGTGSGATFTVAVTALGWVDLLPKQAQPGDSNEFEVILQGLGSGGDQPHVGIRTDGDGGGLNPGVDGFELSGMTAYNGANPFLTQPNISPGKYDGGTLELSTGCYCPCGLGTIDFYLYGDSRHLKGCLFTRSTSSVTCFYIGFFDQVATDTDYPQPLLILGCTNKVGELPNDEQISSLVHPFQEFSRTTRGPGLYYTPGGAWKTVANGRVTSSGALSTSNKVQTLSPSSAGIWPLGGYPTATERTNNFTEPNRFVSSILGYPRDLLRFHSDAQEVVGTTNSPLLRFRSGLHTNSVDESFGRIPAKLGDPDDDRGLVGSLRGVYLFHATATVGTSPAFNDRVIDGDRVFRVFNQGNMNAFYDYFLMEEV